MQPTVFGWEFIVSLSQAEIWVPWPPPGFRKSLCPMRLSYYVGQIALLSTRDSRDKLWQDHCIITVLQWQSEPARLSREPLQQAVGRRNEAPTLSYSHIHPAAAWVFKVLKYCLVSPHYVELHVTLIGTCAQHVSWRCRWCCKSFFGGGKWCTITMLRLALLKQNNPYQAYM